jgi:CubicO group peptidase (beta-lactamase class C family)
VRLAGLLALAFPVLAFGAPDEDKLGKWQGYPACAALDGGELAQRCLVGLLSTWDKLVPTRVVARGPAPLALKPAPLEPIITYKHRDNPPSDLGDFLSRHRNTGLLVLQGDTVLYERYQYGRKPEHRFHSFSMAKTVVAMLVGIALHEKKIASIDDLAKTYLPQLEGHPYGETRLRDLLTMSSGMAFRDGGDEDDELSARTYLRKGAGGIDTVLPFGKREAPPGTRFKYASSDSQVLALALRAAVGMPLAEYLSRKIWQPMGAEADATWHLDAAGQEFGHSGINATLRDWGRLGMLLANDGELNGRQIVPAEWVRAMTTAESAHLEVGVASRFNGYGYQTWLIGDPRLIGHPREGGDGKRRFALLGVRGQALFVDPETKTVVVHTAVHATQRDLDSRAEQFSVFRGILSWMKQNS